MTAPGDAAVPTDGTAEIPARSRSAAPALPHTFTVTVPTGGAAVSTGSIPIVPSQRPRTRRGARPAQPLGSIALAPARTRPGTVTCARCGSAELTNLQLTLTDGSPVVFVSCHACEHRGWFAAEGSGECLSLESVLGSSTKPT